MRPTYAGPQSSTDKKYKATLDPGKTAPSTAAGSPADFYSRQSKDLEVEISKEHSLKHVETVDKAAPKIEPVSVKKVDRTPFINEVQQDHSLRHPDAIHDRSEPIIEEDVTVKKSNRSELLNEVREKGGNDDE